MQIKKMNEKIELNVAGQGCLSDCPVTKWKGKTQAAFKANGAYSGCKAYLAYTAKTSILL